MRSLTWVRYIVHLNSQSTSADPTRRVSVSHYANADPPPTVQSIQISPLMVLHSLPVCDEWLNTTLHHENTGISPAPHTLKDAFPSHADLQLPKHMWTLICSQVLSTILLTPILSHRLLAEKKTRRKSRRAFPSGTKKLRCAACVM